MKGFMMKEILYAIRADLLTRNRRDCDFVLSPEGGLQKKLDLIFQSLKNNLNIISLAICADISVLSGYREMSKQINEYVHQYLSQSQQNMFLKNLQADEAKYRYLIGSIDKAKDYQDMVAYAESADEPETTHDLYSRVVYNLSRRGEIESAFQAIDHFIGPDALEDEDISVALTRHGLTGVIIGGCPNDKLDTLMQLIKLRKVINDSYVGTGNLFCLLRKVFRTSNQILILSAKEMFEGFEYCGDNLDAIEAEAVSDKSLENLLEDAKHQIEQDNPVKLLVTINKLREFCGLYDFPKRLIADIYEKALSASGEKALIYKQIISSVPKQPLILNEDCD